MRELVIVIADLYLPHGEEAEGARTGITAGTAPGIDYAGRYGERVALVDGWRAWLARRLGRADLAGVAPARIAARACPDTNGTAWIATPVQLVAGLTQVHLPAHGILRLPPPELAALAASFGRELGGPDLALRPLPCGEFLLFTGQMPPLATLEPACAVGADLAQSLPHGPQAAALRRLGAEIEMWLHGEPLNVARTRRGEAPVTSLWLWGSEGSHRPPGADTRIATGDAMPRACGSDAWVDGLWRILGSASETLPRQLAIRDSADASLELWVLELRQEPGTAQAPASLVHALAELDARFVSPALELLRRGTVETVNLIANDVRVTLGPRSGHRLWRRARPGLGCFL